MPSLGTRPDFPILSYGDLKKRFKSSESASYRMADGKFIDKSVSIGPIAFCFRSRGDRFDEIPYLIEVRKEIKKKS